MKLRNKKTGEIITCGAIDTLDLDMRSMKYFRNFGYSSLKELNDNWEDYEEPKVDALRKAILILDDTCSNYDEKELEPIVEKLKAWKRLKDKGFRFVCYMRRSDWADLQEVKALENLIDITAYLPKDKIKEMGADLDLLFGGEE